VVGSSVDGGREEEIGQGSAAAGTRQAAAVVAVVQLLPSKAVRACIRAPCCRGRPPAACVCLSPSLPHRHRLDRAYRKVSSYRAFNKWRESGGAALYEL